MGLPNHLNTILMWTETPTAGPETCGRSEKSKIRTIEETKREHMGFPRHLDTILKRTENGTALCDVLLCDLSFDVKWVSRQFSIYDHDFKMDNKVFQLTWTEQTITLSACVLCFFAL